MSYLSDREKDQEARRQAARLDKLRADQFRSDFQAVLNMAPARRILNEFLHAVGIDRSAFATNAMQQSHAIGLQDAGKWWLNAIREHCPEKEGQLRREAQLAQAPKPAPDEEDEHE